MIKSLRPSSFVLAMGYRDDEWVSSVLHVEQLHKTFSELAGEARHDGVRPLLFAPALGHKPSLLERRWKYGHQLPAASLLHLIDPAYADGLLFARSRVESLVATVTDVAFWLKRNPLNTFLRRRIIDGLRVADCRIAISRQTAAEMAQHLDLNADRVVYLGAEPEVFFHGGQARQAGLLLHVGSTIERKGIDRILRFLAVMPEDVRLLQLGGVFTVEQQRLIAALNLTSRIEQHSRVSLAQLVAAYQVCGSLIFPSRYEGYGVPCVEARLCGAPVLTTAVVPALEVLPGDLATKVLPFELFDQNAHLKFGSAELIRRREELAAEAVSLMGRSVAIKNRTWFSWRRVAYELSEAYRAIGAKAPPTSEDLWQLKSS